jgi:hypothetical protein
MRSIVIGFVVLGTLVPQAAAAQWRPPADAERCPSKWGPNDERGAANALGPQTVLRATRLIRTG